MAFTQKGGTAGATQTFSSQDAEDVTVAVEKTADGVIARLRYGGIGGRRLEALCTAAVHR